MKSVTALALVLVACGGAPSPMAASSPANAGAPAVPPAPATAGAEPAPPTAAPATAQGATAQGPAQGGATPHAATIEIPPFIRAAVDAPDRSDADRRLDAGRHPAELLAFAGVAPGMRVAEIGAGTGYTTELLARAVGPKGTVYGENTKFVLERFAA